MIKVISKETLMELLENYFPNEVESRPMNAEAFCNVLLNLIDQNVELPCNFCGTPNREFPKRKCERTPICTNFKPTI